MEKKNRKKIDDELQQLKETKTSVEDSIKELKTSWDNAKIQIKKFLLVVEVCMFSCYKPK